jgi:nitrate/nitrite transport system substrate-binding protein
MKVKGQTSNVKGEVIGTRSQVLGGGTRSQVLGRGIRSQVPGVRSENWTRRGFVKATASTAGALLAGLPSGWTGAVYADDSPETKTIRFGIIALTDCAPIVMAHELGYFKKFGIESVISKEASWAVIRDKLSLGENQATHMLIGMPLASSMGLAGSPVKPMVIPWLLNRNGQAITLNNKLKQAGVRKPADVKPLAEKAKASGEPLAFAMTFPPGTHAMWMRYWLAAGGVHPDKDVSLITIPPPQMVANMKVDKMDGFCVGEPWNNRAIEDGIGFTVITTQQMWKDHPEKVCAFTEEFATKNPKTVKAILKALHLASVDLDKMENRPKFAEVISRPAYINCPPAIILERLLGKYEYGDGRVEQDPFYMIYSNRNCNYPHQIYAQWWLTQFRRWGMTKGAPDYAGIPKRVMRSDLYLDAMKEMGIKVTVAEEKTITLFDGAYDGKDPDKYARSFSINSVQG